MNNIQYGLIIIGGGPIGIACGIEAALNNISYLIIEKGCLVNSLYHYPQNMTFFSTSEKLEVGNVPFVSNSPKPRRDEALEYYRRVTMQYNLNMHLFERVLSVDKKTESFTVHTNKENYTADKIIVATGFYDIPALMHIPGEDLPKVSHYYNNPHFYSKQKVIITGASNSAVDAALEIYRKGGNVTMVVRGSQIGDRVKYWVRPDIINRIEEGSIKACYNSCLAAIHPYSADIRTPDGLITIDNDFVLALTGYRPDFNFLKMLGIHLSDDGRNIPVYDNETMETNIPGMYLAGVICGGTETHKWFIENSRVHAVKILGDMVEKQKKAG